jgi:primase-polymerase (primpol)-like protein
MKSPALHFDEDASTYLVPSMIPAGLRERRAWMFWNAAAGPDNRTRKAPHRYNARTRLFEPSDNTDPKGWMPYDDALELALKHGMGLGSVLNGDGVIVMDIDAGQLPKRAARPNAHELMLLNWREQMLEVAVFAGTFAERSASGTGMHIWGFGDLSLGGSDGRNVRPCEIYRSGRFMIVTGRHIQPTPYDLRVLPEERVAAIVRRFFQKGTRRRAGGKIVGLSFDLDIDVDPMDLEELISLCRDDFIRLVATEPGAWAGHTGPRGESFPSQSEADYWLMRQLAWLTGGDAERMNRLFRASALMRDKYNQRRGAQTYGAILLGAAIHSYTERRKKSG